MNISLNMNAAHASWHSTIKTGLSQVSPNYLHELTQDSTWLPGPQQIFNAFSFNLPQVNAVLLGESPYPRPQSANGYAFWDAAVTNLWSTTGLSKPVNRATSLRNIIKMLLVAEGFFNQTPTQSAIANLDKKQLITTNGELFTNLNAQGILLLNASLVLRRHNLRTLDATNWRPFIKIILNQLIQLKPTVTILLFGTIAQKILPDLPATVSVITAPHPYNLEFIQNSTVLNYFQSLHLLRRNQHTL